MLASRARHGGSETKIERESVRGKTTCRSVLSSVIVHIVGSRIVGSRFVDSRIDLSLLDSWDECLRRSRFHCAENKYCNEIPGSLGRCSIGVTTTPRYRLGAAPGSLKGTGQHCTVICKIGSSRRVLPKNDGICFEESRR